jgi:hypothetical protein
LCTKRSSVAGDGLRRFAVDGYLKGANLSGHERRTIYYRLAVLGHHER